MLPSIKDLAMYVNKKLTELDWNNNWQKIVNWLTAGNTDVKFKSVEISQDGGLVNNGSLTQNGNLTVGGDAEVTGNLSVNGTLTGDGSGLTGVVSVGQIAYTTFSINSGYTDANGAGDLFNYTADVSTSIEFKVDDGTTYKPITFTNAKGKTTTLEAINSYDLSQTDAGTYLVYLTENATAVTLSDNGAKIYRQPYAPASPSASDIWLDTSGEGLKSYVRQSGTWVETNLVLLGDITINNHKVQSANTFVYNWNGYNITIGNCKNLQSFAQNPRVVVKSYATEDEYYRLYSDGWIEQGGYCQSIIGEGGGRAITFLYEMADNNYRVFGGAVPVTSTTSGRFLAYSRTTTGMTVDWSLSTATDRTWWEVKGFIK